MRYPQAGDCRRLASLAEAPSSDVAAPSADVVQLDGDYGPTPPPRVGGGVRKGGRCLSLSVLCLFALCAQPEARPSAGQASRGGGGTRVHGALIRQISALRWSAGRMDGAAAECDGYEALRLVDEDPRGGHASVASCGGEIWLGLHYISTDDRRRAAKLASLVLYMLDETTLAYGSISLYLWGVWQHMVLHRQAGPIYGVPNWREFMSSI